ncbi:uncharacterized protein METZ01_LOCUS210450 [marine metagenome]|uniref:Uncharacterized protein n=1 Tax=marine metagenome TaxID=408172 RepID=A0A382F3L1_9ZZZZ
MLVLFLSSSILFSSAVQLNYIHFYYASLYQQIINYEKN